MAVSGGMVWAFECKIIEVEGSQYIVTSERSYYPREKVMDPSDVVEALSEDPSRSVWCRLLGANNKLVKKLWEDREK